MAFVLLVGHIAMSELVTAEELAQARNDADFRQKFLSFHLEQLLEALKQLRNSEPNPETARQLREGVLLAVKMADRLQATALDPKAA
jgi:CCR4-NOT transcriptional regulation complex NOT5 subunit